MSDLQNERREFEEWAKEPGHPEGGYKLVKTVSGAYINPETRCAWRGWLGRAQFAAAPGAECKSCTILRRYEKTARERGYAMGKAAGNNELAQVQELLAFERKAHAETNAALTAEITRLEALLAAAPAQEPAAWICIYDDGEVDYTPLRELAEAAPKAIPLYRSAAAAPVGAQEALDESAAIIIKQADRIAELKAQLACFEQDPNLHYNVPEDGGPITSYYVAPATAPTADWDAAVALVNKRALERLRNAAAFVLGVIAVHGEIQHDDPRLTELIRATEGGAK